VKVLGYVLVLILGFLIAFIPMWARSRKSSKNMSNLTNRSDVARGRNELASTAAAKELALARMQNSLANVVIDARRGGYESARQNASTFFTSLRAEANKGDDSSLSKPQKEAAKPMFEKRDEIVTLLARSDPAGAERLSDLYLAFRELMDNPAGLQRSPASDAVQPA
jgi:hypothetical protein